MNAHYEELIDGEKLFRSAPNSRHEKICEMLHTRIAASLPENSPAKLLPPRSNIQLSASTHVRPDLALITAATGKIWMAIEIVDSQDHQADTVLKKGLYEDFKLPRLWMVDPRYNNVEIYHGTQYGLALRGILGGSELLQDPLLPDFALTMDKLFSV